MSKKLLNAWVYFRRGHQVYLTFGIALLNFVTIQHQLLIKNVPWLAELFPTIHSFAFIAIIIYTPISVFLGWIDYKKLTVPRDGALFAKANPNNQDMAKALILIAEGKPEQVRGVLQKWLK